MRLIVVGTGWAGEKHVLAVKALQREGVDVGVAALVDVDPDHLAAKASEWRIDATHVDLASALVAHPDAGAVVLATPHHLHRQGTEQAAAAGRHVLVEKPMALTLADADAMIDVCDRAGVMLMVLESVRYQRPIMAAAQALQFGAVGQILSGRMNMIGKGWHTYAYPGRRAWLADPAGAGTGIWMLNGIHEVSAARMLFGEVVRIDTQQVKSDQFESDLEATVVALLTFESGAVVTMTVSAELHGYKTFGDLVVFGADGTLHLKGRDAKDMAIYTTAEPSIVDCANGEIHGVQGQFVRQLQEFLSALHEGRGPETSGSSERQSLAVVLAGYESLRTGLPVTLAPVHVS